VSKPAWKLVLNFSGAAFLMALFGLYEVACWAMEQGRGKGG
jgi:hypothetical protein